VNVENRVKDLAAVRGRFAALASSPVWRRIARGAADLLFPPACVNCRAATEAAGSLCPDCWSQVRFIERPFCERLGTPFELDLGADGLLSPEAVADPPAFFRARAVAQFDEGPVRELTHRLKYNDRLELAQPIGAWMARAGGDLLLDADLLVPVPLHRSRLMSRRFNQANALAQVVSGACGVPVDPFVLERVKPTAPQVRLSRSQRELNVQGAFPRAKADRGADARMQDRPD
jgi:predicted amidophosphoribosyltransferase